MSYTPPAWNEADFELVEYTVPNWNEADFEFEAVVIYAFAQAHIIG